MKYHNITKADMLNGDGLRVVLWVSGCSQKCKGCHNPITWDPNCGLPFTDKEKEEIFEQLEQEYISGITFSGGDPLFLTNREEVTKLAKEIKEKYPNKTIWLYTGYTYEEIKNLEIIQYLDILVDGEFIQELFNEKLEWCGSSNQRIIDVKNTLLQNKIILYGGK